MKKIHKYLVTSLIVFGFVSCTDDFEDYQFKSSMKLQMNN